MAVYVIPGITAYVRQVVRSDSHDVSVDIVEFLGGKGKAAAEDVI